MSADGPVSRDDVAMLQALASRIRTAAGQMHAAAAPLDGLSGHVSHLIGGTASGRDRDFTEMLLDARASIAAAIADCAEASGGVTRAAIHAQAQLATQEREASRRV